MGRLDPMRRREIENKLANHIQLYINPGDDLPNPADEEDDAADADGDGDGSGDDEKEEVYHHILSLSLFVCYTL